MKTPAELKTIFEGLTFSDGDDTMLRFIEMVQNDAASAPSVMEGWQLVPIEPTYTMVKSGYNCVGIYAWENMLAAAPKQPDYFGNVNKMTDIERRLIVNDSRVCWLYSDGSHRALTQDDCDIINTRAAPVDECKAHCTYKRDLVSETENAVDVQKLAEFLSEIEENAINEMNENGVLWALANTETKIHMLFEHVLFIARNPSATGKAQGRG